MLHRRTVYIKASGNAWINTFTLEVTNTWLFRNLALPQDRRDKTCDRRMKSAKLEEKVTKLSETVERLAGIMQSLVEECVAQITSPSIHNFLKNSAVRTGQANSPTHA